MTCSSVAAHCSSGSLPGRAALANASAFLGMVTYTMGNYPAGHRLLEEGLAIKRALDDRWGGALCLRHLGMAAYDQGAYGEARRLLGESLALSRAMGSPWSIAYSLNVLGIAACAQGAYAEAQQQLHEALALSQVLADRYNTASAKSGLGMVHQALGDRPEARRCFEESLAIWREIGEQGGLAQTLNRYGQCLSAQADGQMARRCFLEALAVARNAEIIPMVLDALLGVAALQAEEGNVEAALEMVVHVLQDAAHTQGAHNQAERLRANLESDLTAEQIDRIRERALDQTRDALVRELLDAL